MLPRAKAPTLQARVVAEEDAHAAEPRALVDLGRDEAHGAGDLAEARDLDARGLADLDGGHARLGDLGVELDLALGDDAEHGLGGARRIAADARHAAADDAVGRRHHLGAAAPPGQLAALGLDLRLLGLGRLEAVAGGDELRLRRARRLLALVVGALGHVAGRAQGLGPLERVAALDQARLGLHDGAPGLGDGRRGAGERRRRSGRAGRRACRRPAAPARRPSSRACLRRPAPR